MRTYKTKLVTQQTINAVTMSGLLQFLMFPLVLFGYHFPDFGFLTWIYLVPILLCIHQYNLKSKLLLAWLSAMLGFYGMFYWLAGAMQEFGGLNFFQSLGVMIVMFAIMSLYQALFLGLACWINLIVRLPLFILLPIFLLTRDLIIQQWPIGGFPWGTPAYSQGEWLRFFQWVDVTGTHGLSLFIYLINGLIADGLLLFIHRKQIDKMVSRGLVVLVLVFLSLYGSFLSGQKYEREKTVPGDLSVALIQGNISQDIKWDPYKAQNILHKYIYLTNTAVKNGAQLVIWPETAFPYAISSATMSEDKFLDQDQMSMDLFLGAVVADTLDGQRVIYNSAVHVDQAAGFVERHAKMHLVPFGEYVPFQKYLKFAKKLTQGVGNFVPGDSYSLFTMKGFKFGSLICYEDIFPDFAREFSRLGADILVNYTNDGWYGDTSAQHQHLVYSQFRALENRRYLFRATNTGMTAIITPRGELYDKLTPFKETFLLQNLKLEKAESLYTRFGERWVYGVALLCTLIFAYTVIKYKLGPVKKEF